MGELFVKYVLRTYGLYTLPFFVLYLISPTSRVLLFWSVLFVFVVIGSLLYTIYNFKKIGITWKDLKDEHFKTSHSIIFFTPLSIRQIVDEMHKNNYFDKAFYTFSTKENNVKQVEIYEMREYAFRNTTMTLTATPINDNLYELKVKSEFNDRKWWQYLLRLTTVNMKNIQEVEQLITQKSSKIASPNLTENQS